MAISKIQEFVNVILEILSPMSNVNVIKNKGHIVLYKDGVMFGKIIEQSVLFFADTALAPYNQRHRKQRLTRNAPSSWP